MNNNELQVIAYAVLIALLIFSLVRFFRHYQAMRFLLDTPTSKIRSAAQGYVELFGLIKQPEEPLVAPLTGSQCVWWRYIIEERNQLNKKNTWQVKEDQSSTRHFILNDGTGDCLIDPEGAEIYPVLRTTWYGNQRYPNSAERALASTHVLHTVTDRQAKYRYIEWRLEAEQPLYAIGDFHSRGGGSYEPEIADELKQVISEWKRDYAQLLVRFDHNRDGQLDQQEWQQVRHAAEQYVLQQRQLRAALPASHYLTSPRHGRPFVLSNYGEDKTVKQLKVKVLESSCIALVAAAGLAYLTQVVMFT